jgi:hypothetical protein
MESEPDEHSCMSLASEEEKSPEKRSNMSHLKGI